MAYHSVVWGWTVWWLEAPTILTVLDNGHIGGYTEFKQMFEYGVIYQYVKLCRNIDNYEK